MRTHCSSCHRPVYGKFQDGYYHFRHCGSTWKVPARNHGQAKSGSEGTAAGAALGAVGALAAAVNPLGGLLVGALVGSAFNTDNSRPCHKCGKPAYPTGRRGQRGDPMYQCSGQNCRAFTFVRR